MLDRDIEDTRQPPEYPEVFECALCDREVSEHVVSVNIKGQNVCDYHQDQSRCDFCTMIFDDDVLTKIEMNNTPEYICNDCYKEHIG